MAACPECGNEEEYNSETCSHCQYTFRYDDRTEYDPEDIVFTVKYKCRNCSRTFKHGFGEGDEVRPKGRGKSGFSINEVTGNPYLEIVDGKRCRPLCPTCKNDTSLVVQKRTPVRER